MNWLPMTFTLCAVLGGTIFAILFIMQFFIGGGDLDTDVGGHHADLTGADVSFKFLSMQGITAFLMMFGLAGRAFLEGETLPALSFAGAVAIGLGAVWVIGRIFHFMKKLQSSGTVDMGKAVGQRGSVYLTIPADGIGKVQVAVNNRLGVFNAVTEHGRALATGTSIKVTRVMEDHTFVVEEEALQGVGR